MKSLKLLLAAALGVVAAGCAAGGLQAAVRGPRAAESPAEVKALQPDDDTPQGELQISIRWPGSFTSQTIPTSATALELSLATPAGALVATASIVRPTTTAAVKKLKVGTYDATAVVKRSDGTILAQATASAAVTANTSSQVNLTLQPRFQPRIRYISPSMGPLSGGVTIYGDNLAGPKGLDGANLVAVLANGVPIASDSYESNIGSGSITINPLPATTSATLSLSVVVDGVANGAANNAVFTVQTIDHIKISPTTTTINVSTASFVATAWADATESVKTAGFVQFVWGLEKMNPATYSPSPGVPDQPSMTMTSEGFFTSYVKNGSATVTASAGGKSATASITVAVP
jgi:hypothetical protein